MGDGSVRALDGVDVEIAPGERVGLVGESGSGKSTLGMAVGRLLATNASFDQGSIHVDGLSVCDAGPQALRQLRRTRLGFVFQNPMTALNPTLRIGRQLALAWGMRADGPQVEHWLGRVGLTQPARVAASFPHELSGGMAQRVVIAMAMARRPALLIADEPTASLDASVQGVVLDLLDELLRESGSGLILMSHDLRMVAQRCDRVLVMYGGRLVEAGRSGDVLERPRHPYTHALSRAAAGNEAPGGRLQPIPGAPPLLRARAAGCTFAPRCAQAAARCFTDRPADLAVGDSRVACHFAGEEAAP
jgi:oligopeptide/dipeptide ABC transporter ATP-binding protein